MHRRMAPSPIRPVQKQSAEAQTTKNLRDYILSGAVPPGGRLTEIPLAAQLGVGRATLRTSLHRLADEGIVLQTPYVGWQVTALAEEDVWELWTLRGSLEGLAAKLAADTMTPAMRAQVEAAVAELAQACATGNVEAASAADFGLHRVIVGMVNHGRLQNQYRQVEQQVRLYISASNALLVGDLGAIVTQHEPLVAALYSGDGSRAATEAWRHNESEGGKLVAWLKNQERSGVT